MMWQFLLNLNLPRLLIETCFLVILQFVHCFLWNCANKCVKMWSLKNLSGGFFRCKKPPTWNCNTLALFEILHQINVERISYLDILLCSLCTSYILKTAVVSDIRNNLSTFLTDDIFCCKLPYEKYSRLSRWSLFLISSGSYDYIKVYIRKKNSGRFIFQAPGNFIW